MGIFLPWSYFVQNTPFTMSLLNWASHWRQQRCCLIFPWWRISLLHCCNQARHLWEIRSRKSFWAPFLWVIQLIGDDVSSLKFNPEHGLGVIKCFVMQRFWNQPQKTNKQTNKKNPHTYNGSMQLFRRNTNLWELRDLICKDVIYTFFWLKSSP